MKNYDEIEKLLADTPIPKVIEGPHRSFVKRALLQKNYTEGIPMRNWKKTLAWACCLVLFAGVAGLAGKEIYKVVSLVLVPEQTMYENEEVVMPDGTKFVMSQKYPEVTISTKTDDPNFNPEEAKKLQAELRSLIAQGKFTLLKDGTLPSGEKEYIYKFILSNGKEHIMDLGIPLSRKDDQPDGKEISRLMAEGMYKLISEEKTPSGESLYTYRLYRHNGMIYDLGPIPWIPKKK